jgi:NDP-sugar pyrophosphorylase family protein
MRAIILATGNAPGTAPLNEHYPTPLFPLVDRPFLQHVIEYCINQGVTQFDFVLSHLPEKIEHYCGDGKRWGSRFTYHLARDPAHPYRLLKALQLDGGSEGRLLLGHADRLSRLDLHEATAAGTLPLLFSWNDDTGPATRQRWTGWALLAPEHITGLPRDADEAELEAYLRSQAGERSWRDVPRPLSMATFDDILAAHRNVLAKTFPGLFLSGREADPGIWLSRNVKLHPTAHLVPPVFVCENCSIGAGAELGPNAVIGKDCFLDSHARVANSVIFPGSYVGELLEVEDVILDKNRLINVRLGGAAVTDGFTDRSDDQFFPWTVLMFARLAALLLLLLATPVLLLTALCLKLTGRRVLCWREAVQLPAPPEERRWRTFQLLSFDADAPSGQGVPCSIRALLLRFLPSLIHIVKGELHFVGVPPRTREEIQLLQHDWQTLVLRGKVGILTEASVRYGTAIDADDQYASENCYVATASWRYDLKLLLRFFALSLLGFRRSSAGAGTTPVDLDDEDEAAAGSAALAPGPNLGIPVEPSNAATHDERTSP